MSNIQVTSGVTYNVTGTNGIALSKSAQERFRNIIPTLEKLPGVRSVHADIGDKRAFFAFTVNWEIDFQGFNREVMTLLCIVGDHGSDSDILADLFSRYPHLKNHPDSGRIVGAFDNLVRVVQEVDGKAAEPVVPYDSGAVAAFRTTHPDAGRAMAREEHRRKALIGQLPEQKKKKMEQVEPGTPRIPDAYSVFVEKKTNG